MADKKMKQTRRRLMTGLFCISLFASELTAAIPVRAAEPAAAEQTQDFNVDTVGETQTSDESGDKNQTPLPVEENAGNQTPTPDGEDDGTNEQNPGGEGDGNKNDGQLPGGESGVEDENHAQNPSGEDDGNNGQFPGGEGDREDIQTPNEGTEGEEPTPDAEDGVKDETPEDVDSVSENDVEMQGEVRAFAASANVVQSGSYGNITWTIDADGKLTVEGTGEFSASDGAGRAPWHRYAASVKSAEIKVTGMKNASYMFEGCKNLASMDLSAFESSSVTDMSHMFQGCCSGVSYFYGDLDFSELDTSNVTDMSYMFQNYAYKYAHGLDLSGFDTSKVQNMSHMFEHCDCYIGGMNLSSFDTGNVTDMSYMFNDCNCVSEDVARFDTRNVTDMNHMFFDTAVGGDVLDLSGYDTGSVTNMESMFAGCGAKYLDVSGFETSNVTNMNGMFNACSVDILDVSSFDLGNVTDMRYMFMGCSATSVNLSGCKPGEGADLSKLFAYCRNLVNVDLSGFDTSNVVNISSMFESCESLTSVDLSGLNTSKMENISYLFAYCPNLVSVDLSHFDTNNVIYMQMMFSECDSLTTVDLSGFRTGSTTQIQYMFFGCKNLRSVDLGNFDTSNVIYIDNMFHGCSSLASVDLSSFDLKNLEFVNGVFEDDNTIDEERCNNLTIIYTPYHVPASLDEEDLKLPKGTWYDAQGKKYTSLPRDTDHSILLMKGKKPAASQSIKAEKKKTVYKLGEEVTLADLTVTYYRADGSVKKLNSTEYRTNIEEINADPLTGGTKVLTVIYENGGDILTAEIPLTVGDSFSMLGVTIELPEEKYVYDGEKKQPVPTVSYSLDGEKKKLREGWDYTVSYRNNIDAYEGSLEENTANNAPTVVITGLGDYSGTVTKAFRIEKASAPMKEEITVYVPECEKKDTWRTYDVSGCFAAYGKKTKYRIGKVAESEINGKKVLSCKPIIDTKGKFSYCPNTGTDGTFATVTVDISFANYQDSSLDIKLQFQLEKEMTISGITMNNSVYTGFPVSYGGTLHVEGEYEGLFTDESSYVHEYSYTGTRADGTPYGAEGNDDTDASDGVGSLLPPVDAGRYKMTLTVWGEDVYGSVYAGIREYPFEISPAPVTITALDKTLTKGTTMPDTYDYRVTGLLNGDTLVKEPSFTYNADEELIASGTPGIYDLIPGNADAGMNYKIVAYNSGKLRIAEENIAYAVSFDLSGHEDKAHPIIPASVLAGGLISEPEEPVAEGYTFTGWYTDRSFSQKKKWNFDTDIVQSDMVLYACWLANATEDGSSGPHLCIQDIQPQAYTGNAIKPNVIVYDSDGNTPLKAGKDYTIKYAQNTKAVLADEYGTLPHIGVATVTNAGKKDEVINNVFGRFNKECPYVIISGKGNYTETIYKNFYICPVNIAAEDADNNVTLASGFTLKYSDQLVKNGRKEQTPFQSLKYKKAMKPGEDYTVTLKAGANVKCDADAAAGEDMRPQEWVGKTEYNSKNKKYGIPAIPKGYYGTFTMTVTGIGNYKGQIVKDIYVTENAGGLVKNAVITLGKNQKKMNYDGSGVQLTPGYYDADNRKYFALEDGQEKSKDDIFTVSVKNGKTVTYLKYDSKDRGNSDYFITYENNNAVGTAAMTITGNPAKGYFGSKRITFQVIGDTFNARTIDVKVYDNVTNPNENDWKVSVPYTGKAITQNKVTLVTKTTAKNPTSRTLVYGTHYTISYKSNIKKGTATVTFTAKPESGYSGSFKKSFKISAQNLTADMFAKESTEGAGQKRQLTILDTDTNKNNITVAWDEDAVHTKNGAALSFVLRNPEGMVLKQGTDYTVSYKDHKAATKNADGSPRANSKQPVMTVKGKGCYAGTLTVQFQIVPASLTSDTLTVVAIQIQRKNNMKLKDFKLKVMDGRAVLKEGTDYMVDDSACTSAIIQAYADSLEKQITAPEPKLVLTGIGNYGAKAAGGAENAAGDKREVSLADFIYQTKLTAKNLKVEVIGTPIYTGQNIEPKVRVTYYKDNNASRTDAVGAPLVEGIDYQVTYGNKNIPAGKKKGAVTITGMGIYGGSVTVKFDIEKKSL